jgi:integrase/recombinase XerD
MTTATAVALLEPPTIERPPAIVGRQASSDEQLIELWLHGRPRHTTSAYRRDIARFRQFVEVPLGAVTLVDLQAFADELEAQGLAPASRGRTLAAVKGLVGFGHKLGYLTFDVGRALRLPARRSRLAERIVDVATMHDLMASEPDARNRALIETLYYGGLRISELVGLRWRDVAEREGGKVQLAVFGKGEKERVVVVPPRVACHLRELRGDAGPDEPVFAGREGALTISRAYQIVKRAAARAGVPALSPHWCRHAHASHALEAGASVAVVSHTLGHNSIATTSVYLHARPGDSSGLYLPV